MNQLSFSNSTISKSKIIASSGIFQIELLKQAGEDDFPQPDGPKIAIDSPDLTLSIKLCNIEV